MTILTPGFILIALVVLAVFLAAAPARKRVDRARRDLSAEDLKTFGDTYRNRANRHDMPSKYNRFAQASDTASRIWVIGVVAIIAALAAYIFLGPTLGLPIGGTP
ncbi:hypothetical protein [Jannaschia sp. CCS1]|uniref:hypothetical protein n=1 Tax=Jannaschia sp. (strain CCS1) TaxID=290400 RepID=UPI000053C7C2|nr:hypothetical protein [Jannaschia sp. CCS1]ABD53704.1 hypothetical protein Jann_0787 [Jannaschia sp. CCS1]